MKAKTLYAVAALGGLAMGVVAWRRATALDLRGKVVLITGGSRGLGLALARAFIQQGARVLLLARNSAELAQAQEQLTALGGDAATLVCDITDAKSIDSAVASTLQTFGRIDVLVNNAGQIQVGPLDHMSVEDFDKAFDLHVRAPLRLILAVSPIMQRQGQGRIVNIASFGGVIAVPHMAPYSASKFALLGLSDAMRTELSGSGIKVTTVCPGLMRTGSHVHAQFKGDAEAEYTWFTSANTLPVMSIDADRAARKIVWAARLGTARIDLTLPARLGRIAAGLAPNLVARALTTAVRLLPASEAGAGTASHPGSEFAPGRESATEKEAADRNNERFDDPGADPQP